MSITTKKILSLVFLFAVMGLPLIAGAQLDATKGASEANLSTTSFYYVILAVMNWLLIIITVLAVIGFIISGVYFITAGGSGRADEAKSWLTYSIIGIIVALIGYIIVQLVDNLLRGNASY